MKYRKLTATGDYSFGGNQTDYIEGANAVGQAVKTKLLLFYQEWWEDLGLGIPMFQSFIGQTNPETIKTSLSMVIENRILEVPEVKSVENVEIHIDRRTRSMSFDIDVVTANGDKITVEVSV